MILGNNGQYRITEVLEEKELYKLYKGEVASDPERQAVVIKVNINIINIL